MSPARVLVAALGLTAVLNLAGCFAMRRPITTNVEIPPSPAPLPAPPVPQAMTEAAPKAEPKSRYGNPPFYDVFGKRYYVLSSSAAYVERGVASWYGPGFHKVKTSNGELYDMYGMSAAHKTLPLPAHVRVTNLQNGRSVVVRVNDRGPFVGNRIIDLSYTAAAKLDMLHNGTAMVEVRSLDSGPPAHDPGMPLLAATSAPALAAPAPIAKAPPMAMTPAVTPTAGAANVNLGAANGGIPAQAATGAGAPGVEASGTAAPGGAPSNAAALVGIATVAAATATTPAPATTTTSAPATTSASASAASPSPAGKPILFVQAGAFSDPANAERLAVKLRGGSYGTIFVRDDVIAGRRMYRVRIGPVPNVQAFDRIFAALERDGVHDAHLALD